AIAAIEMMRSVDLVPETGEDRLWRLAQVSVRRRDGIVRSYFLSLGISWDGGDDPGILLHALARVRKGAMVGTLYEAACDSDFGQALLAAIRSSRVLAGSDAQVACFRARAFPDDLDPAAMTVRRITGEQSNTSLVLGDRAVLKLYRRLEEGLSVELEMNRYLTEIAGFDGIPALYGGLALMDSVGKPVSLGILQAFVANQGDAWSWTCDYLQRFLDENSMLPAGEVLARPDLHGDYLILVRTLAERLAGLHRALAIDSGERDFEPEAIEAEDLMAWRRRAREQAETAIRLLAGDDGQALPAERLLTVIEHLLPEEISSSKSRIHGDLHLGQVLVVKNDVSIIDFEGEPARALADRRAKDSPLRDVAGMLRSFNYATWHTLFAVAAARPGAETLLEPLAQDWEDRVTAMFLDTYRLAVRGAASVPTETREFHALLRLFLIEKACYEIAYEVSNRPSWVAVPVKGVFSLLQMAETVTDGEQDEG
ncbi:MAG: putative maltokinase, partial [Rhodospirillales bacterium]|nr:putative maltokinase [Rhodospirillales bacterium]